MSLFDNLPHAIDIYGPPLVTVDNAGGEVITWPTLRAGSVPCLICANQGGERDEFNQSQRTRNQYTIAFSDYDGGVDNGDKIIDLGTGATYRFTGDRPQQGVGGIASWQLITVTQLS